MAHLRTVSFLLASLAAACTVHTQPAGPMGPAPGPVVASPTPTPAPAPTPAPPPPPPAPPPPPVVVVAPPPAPPPPPPPPPPVVRDDDRGDRRFDRSSDWDKLGERWVEGRVDRDSIKVGKGKHRYRALAVVVEHSALEMFDMVVEFGDGTSFSPNLRLVFGPNATSRVIDLPGDARFIKKVEFRYGNLPGGGKAQVELWGLDAKDDDHDGHDGRGKGKGHGKGRGHGHD
ncbi:MAG: hypothetical protein IPH44_13480 [Myxococcales bacterium]|nr:hypothetical protein [Myxococcales bacterium]